MPPGVDRPLLKPNALRPGQVVGVCAPSGPVRDPAALDAGLDWLRAAGFEPRCGTHLRARQGYLAGSDDERLADLRELLADPDVRAIVPVRGGYGLPRYLSRLDTDELRAARTLVIGYSDATALLLGLHAAGVASLHGPMLERDDIPAAARERVLALASGALPDPLDGQSVRGGRARGPAVGGNLRMIAASLGTPWEIDTRGAVLFFEEVGEQPYAIDRSLVQLREAGKLRDVAGVAIGQLVNCQSERYPEVSASDAVRDILLSSSPQGLPDGAPVVDALPFGHVADHRALPVGVTVELDGDAGRLGVTEPVVEDQD